MDKPQTTPHQLQVIAVSNRKGGTGKTTVSVNIAAELAAMGRRVLLIDMDTQGHCAVGLGVKVGKDDATIHSLFRHREASLTAAIQSTAFEGLSLVPADALFEHGEGLRDETVLKTALAEAAIVDQFDVVILDTPPSHDILLLNALIAANWLLVPYVPHPLSFEGVRQLTRVLFKIISGPNKKLKVAGFLPMMSSDHIRVHRTVKEGVSQQFGSSKVLPGIRNDISLAESFAHGKPIRYYAPKSRAAEDFAQLREFLLQLCP